MATSKSGAGEAQQYASFLEQQSWTSHSDASMATPRWGCAAVVVDGQIIVVGGLNYEGNVLSSVERSAVQHSKDDADTLTLSRWSSLPNAPNPRRWFGAAVVPPNFGVSADAAADTAKPNILVAGGFKKYMGGACAEADVFDLSTKRWRNLPSMTMKRGGCAVASWWSSHGSSDGYVYVVGGDDGSKRFGNRLGSVECLSFSARDAAKVPSWKLLPSHMKLPRSSCAAVVVEGVPVHPTAGMTPHQLVVLGGYTDYGATDSVETFDFQTGQWEELPPMKEKRDECAAVAVGQRIYVVGGHNGDEHLATAEYFDFRTCEWTLLPHEMPKRRRGCAAVVVDGHLVVLGGRYAMKDFQCLESIRIAVDDTAPHKIDLPDLPPPTSAVGAGNRIQPLEQWCGTVKELLAKVEADIVERKKTMEKTKDEKMKVGQDIIKAAKKEYGANVEALESDTNDWVRETRHRLQEAQDEIWRCKRAMLAGNTNITNVPPSKRPAASSPKVQVFIQDADGDLVALNVPQGDYAALKQLAAAELDVTPDVISKFRRKSDGVVVKSDSHMSILKREDKLEVVTNNKAPSKAFGNTTTRIIGSAN